MVMPPVACSSDAGKFCFETAKLINTLPYVDQLAFGNVVRTIEVGTTCPLQRQQSLDVGQRQAEVPTVANEAQSI